MSTGERKKREREARIRTILEAAIELFSEKGYESTTMEEIAKRAELSKGLLYFYFDSKEEIFIKIVEEAYDRLLPRLRILKGEKLDPPSKLMKFIETELDFYMKNKRLHQIIVSLMEGFTLKDMEEEHKRVFIEKHREEERILESIIREGISSGHFKDLDGRIMVFALGGIFHGILKLTMDKNYTQRELKEKISEIYLRGILK
jgi:AcrR family transcriptional regulator